MDPLKLRKFRYSWYIYVWKINKQTHTHTYYIYMYMNLLFLDFFYFIIVVFCAVRQRSPAWVWQLALKVRNKCLWMCQCTCADHILTLMSCQGSPTSPTSPSPLGRSRARPGSADAARPIVHFGCKWHDMDMALAVWRQFQRFQSARYSPGIPPVAGLEDFLLTWFSFPRCGWVRMSRQEW